MTIMNCIKILKKELSEKQKQDDYVQKLIDEIN